MFKLFRKIRQKLLVENPSTDLLMTGKISKYLIYALGEIVLVVIGILIALQINNKNQDKINRNYELTMLQEMKVALKKDILNIESGLENLKRINLSAKELIMLQNEPSYDNDSLLYHFNVLRRGGIILTINSSPYESLKSSGLDKISNPKLRNSITYLYEIQLQTTEFWINNFILRKLNQRTDLVREIFEKQIVLDSLGEVKINYSLSHDILYKNPKYVDFLTLSSSYIPIANRHLTNALDAMRIELEHIENEINR